MSNIKYILDGAGKSSKKRLSKKRISKKRISKKRMSKKRMSKKRMSKKRVSKKRMSKKRMSKKRLNSRKNNNSNKRSIFVYTDGSTINNCRNSYKASGGIGVYFGKNDVRNLSEPFFIYPITNNRCELYACIRTLQQIIKYSKNKQHLVIYSDSEYAINSLSKWIILWKKRGWKTSMGVKPVNLDLIYWFDKLQKLYSNKITIDFKHVKAHQKKPNNKTEIIHWNGNKFADKMAKNGMKIAKQVSECK